MEYTYEDVLIWRNDVQRLMLMDFYYEAARKREVKVFADRNVRGGFNRGFKAAMANPNMSVEDAYAMVISETAPWIRLQNAKKGFIAGFNAATNLD